MPLGSPPREPTPGPRPVGASRGRPPAIPHTRRAAPPPDPPRRSRRRRGRRRAALRRTPARSVDERLVPPCPRRVQCLDRSGEPSLLRGPLTRSHVHRADPFGPLHVRLRDGGGAQPSGGGGADPPTRHPAVRTDPRLPLGDRDRLHRAVSPL